MLPEPSCKSEEEHGRGRQRQLQFASSTAELFAELGEVLITGATRAEVVEPRFGFLQWYSPARYIPEKSRARTANSVGFGELFGEALPKDFEQTPVILGMSFAT